MVKRYQHTCRDPPRNRASIQRPAVQGHSTSSKVTRMHRVLTTSYWRAIVALSCTVSDINGDVGLKTQIFSTLWEAVF